MISFGEKKPDNRRFIQAVRTWVEDALPPEHEETTVMVNELQCFEPVRIDAAHTISFVPRAERAVPLAGVCAHRDRGDAAGPEQAQDVQDL